MRFLLAWTWDSRGTVVASQAPRAAEGVGELSQHSAHLWCTLSSNRSRVVNKTLLQPGTGSPRRRPQPTHTAGSEPERQGVCPPGKPLDSHSLVVLLVHGTALLHLALQHLLREPADIDSPAERSARVQTSRHVRKLVCSNAATIKPPTPTEDPDGRLARTEVLRQPTRDRAERSPANGAA